MTEACPNSGVWKATFHFILILLRQYSTDKMENQLTDHGVTTFIEAFICTLRPWDCTSNKYEINTKNIVSYNRHKF